MKKQASRTNAPRGDYGPAILWNEELGVIAGAIDRLPNTDPEGAAKLQADFKELRKRVLLIDDTETFKTATVAFEAAFNLGIAVSANILELRELNDVNESDEEVREDSPWLLALIQAQRSRRGLSAGPKKRSAGKAQTRAACIAEVKRLLDQHPRWTITTVRKEAAKNLELSEKCVTDHTKGLKLQ